MAWLEAGLGPKMIIQYFTLLPVLFLPYPCSAACGYRRGKHIIIHLVWFFLYLMYLGCGSVTRTIVNKIGEDWVFLFMLGGIMALLSFTMDYCIAKLLEGLFVWIIMLYHCYTVFIFIFYLAWLFSGYFSLFPTRSCLLKTKKLETLWLIKALSRWICGHVRLFVLLCHSIVI